MIIKYFVRSVHDMYVILLIAVVDKQRFKCLIIDNCTFDLFLLHLVTE